MSTLGNTGRKTSEPGSTKPAERKEDFKPEGIEPLPSLPDLSIDLDPPSDAKPSGTTTDPDSEEDSLLQKSRLLVSVLSLLNLSALLLITEEKINLRSSLISTSSASITISVNWFFSPDTKRIQSPKPSLASSMTPPRYNSTYSGSAKDCHLNLNQHTSQPCQAGEIRQQVGVGKTSEDRSLPHHQTRVVQQAQRRKMGKEG